MNIKHPNEKKEWLIRKLQGAVWRLENTGNANFKINGELHFAKEIGEYYQNKPFVFFDVGANVGEYTNMVLGHMKTDAAEMHLFEPQKMCFDTLTDKFSKTSSISLNNFGLSDAEEITTLFKDFDKSGLASVYKRNLDHYAVHMDQTEEIELKKAEAYLQEHDIPKINLLKIDIEGHELVALRGFGDFLTPEKIDFIQFEYGGANLDSSTSLLDLFTFFKERGFAVCKMMPNALEIQEYKPRLENFMYQNWVAVNPELI